MRDRLAGLEAEARDRERQQKERHTAVLKQAADTWIALSTLWAERGSRYEDCTLDNFHVTCDTQRAVVQTLRQYVADLPEMLADGVGLIFNGPPGTGKDHLMAAVMREAVNAGARLKWASGPALFARLRDSLDVDSSTETEWIATLRSPTVLAISDPLPPTGGLTNYQAAMLYAAIDGRYNMQRSTWLTMNTGGKDDAAKRLTEPILDRLKHGSIVLLCDWPSYRTVRSKDAAEPKEED